jgi:hypothetical protein
VVIVAACVVVGARILGSADDTVTVWALSGDRAAGAALDPDDLVAKQVRFADASDLAGYFRTDEDLPASAVLVRAVGSGELLPRAAVGSKDDAGLQQVPLSVDPGQVPASVAEGSVVDVYLSGSPSADLTHDLDRPVISDADVVAYVSAADSLAGSGQAQLTVAVKPSEVRSYFSVLTRLDSPVVTIVRSS